MKTDAARTRLIAYLTVGAAGLALAVTGAGVEWGAARTALGVVSAVPLAVNLYDRWLWRIRWLPFGPANLRGVWKASLRSDYPDAATRGSLAPIEAYVVFRQTAVALSVAIYTSESTSASIAVALDGTRDERFEVSWLFRNESRHEHRPDSPIHYGGARLLPFGGRSPARLEGTYFTDRKTMGDFTLTDRRSARPDSFAEAQAVYTDAAG